jgi:hypothetical protein
MMSHFSMRRSAFHIGGVASGLRTVGAILGATTSFDTEEGAELHLVLWPVGLMDFSRFLDQIEKGEIVELFEFFVLHGKKA